MLIHGEGRFFIRLFDPLLYKCPYCDEINSTEVFIYSYYFHIFWIPVFPTRKIAVARCTECNASRSEERFGPKLTEHLEIELKNTRHPFYSWTLLIILCSSVLLTMIIVAFK